MQTTQDHKAHLTQLITAKWISKPLNTLAELKIPDMLADGPLEIQELAKRSESNPVALYRVMRAMTGVGLFNEIKTKVFELTSMGQYLKSGELREMAVFLNADVHEKAWQNFRYSLRTGVDAFEYTHGAPLFDWLEENPAEAEVFHQAMGTHSLHFPEIVSGLYDFSTVGTLADVGGGQGPLLLGILENYPKLKGVLADLPSVLEGADAVVAKRNLQDRVEIHGIDFFKSVPNADAILMSHVLHDWGDESCLKILKNCNTALPKDGRVLLFEFVVPEDSNPCMQKALDLEMLVMTSGGKERTETEFRELFEATGFRLNKLYRHESGKAIIEGIKV